MHSSIVLLVLSTLGMMLLIRLIVAAGKTRGLVKVNPEAQLLAHLVDYLSGAYSFHRDRTIPQKRADPKGMHWGSLPRTRVQEYGRSDPRGVRRGGRLGSRVRVQEREAGNRNYRKFGPVEDPEGLGLCLSRQMRGDRLGLLGIMPLSRLGMPATNTQS